MLPNKRREKLGHGIGVPKLHLFPPQIATGGERGWNIKQCCCYCCRIATATSASIYQQTATSPLQLRSSSRKLSLPSFLFSSRCCRCSFFSFPLILFLSSKSRRRGKRKYKEYFWGPQKTCILMQEAAEKRKGGNMYTKFERKDSVVIFRGKKPS